MPFSLPLPLPSHLFFFSNFPEVPGAIEFVSDPAALATILSGEGVKSCPLGRQSSLAQRVLVRGSQGGTTRRGQVMREDVRSGWGGLRKESSASADRLCWCSQGARASAYLAPRTPIHQLDPARASCFSRLEGPGPRGRTLYPQRLQALVSALEGLVLKCSGSPFQR